jgi:hypothetical protein
MIQIQWRATAHRKGEFDNYTVLGFHYESFQGASAWHIKSWKTGFDPIHDYWVSGKDFYSMAIHYMVNGTDRIEIEIFGLVPGVSEEERKAVMSAIEKWNGSSGDKI